MRYSYYWFWYFMYTLSIYSDVPLMEKPSCWFALTKCMKNNVCKLIHFRSSHHLGFLLHMFFSKCLCQNLERDRRISPSSFDEQMPGLKSYFLSLSIQWIFSYEFAPGSVWEAVAVRIDAGEECSSEICNNNNDKEKW